MSNNIPLRGAKFGLFEGSFRVPAFVYMPPSPLIRLPLPYNVIVGRRVL